MCIRDSADTLGINVSRTRFICVVLSGVMAGFGGASITLAIISQFTQTATLAPSWVLIWSSCTRLTLPSG